MYLLTYQFDRTNLNFEIIDKLWRLFTQNFLKRIFLHQTNYKNKLQLSTNIMQLSILCNNLCIILNVKYYLLILVFEYIIINYLVFCIHSLSFLIVVQKEYNDYFLKERPATRNLRSSRSLRRDTNLKIFPAVWPKYDGSKWQLPVRLPSRPEATRPPSPFALESLILSWISDAFRTVSVCVWLTI